MLSSLILIILFTFLNAIFASAEIAVISFKEARLKQLVQNGDKRAKKLHELTAQPARFLATIQVAITLSGFLNSAFAADNFSGILVDALRAAGVPVPASILHSVSVILVTLLLSYISIVFGELVPKRIAMKNSEALSLGLAPALHGVAKIFSPLVSLLTVSANLLLRLFGINPEDEEEQLSKEEIRLMLATGNEQGIIDNQESEFIQNVFEFHDVTVDEICTHRSDVIVLDAEDSMESWAETIYNCRHSFYPVCKDAKEEIIGVLDTRDYFRLEEKSREAVFAHAVEKAFLIPEGMKASKLLNEMKRTRTYFSVILNEYGEMSGIITLHDLIEELVGEIYDEDEQDPEKIKALGANTWRITGDAEISDIRRKLGIPLPEEDFDTFNGLVYHITGKIPADGSRFVCEAYGMKIHVRSVKNHMVAEAIVTWYNKQTK